MGIQEKPNQSFHLIRRLAHSYEFDAVFDKNEIRLSSASLLVLAMPNSLGFNRLGMVVSKKSTPKSVQRSKLKRRIRESFRKAILSTTPGWDIVLMTRPEINSQQDLTGYLQTSFTSLAEKLRSTRKL